MLTASLIPILMVIAFLLLTLSVAYRFTKPSTSFKEYSVGDKQFPTGYLVATGLATCYGGGTLMRNVELIHHYGLFCMLLILFVSFLSCWIISLLALYMAPFMQHLSMSETIGYVYGSYPRVITSLACVASAIPCIMIQIHVMTLAISMCMPSINLLMLTTIIILVCMLYVTIGGIRAVMVTDIIQLFAFCTILPLFAWWIFTKTGKPLGELLSFAQAQEQFQLDIYNKMDIKNIISLILAYLVAGVTPPSIQKIYMAKDHFQASRVFLNAGITSIFILFFTLIMGLFTASIAPELSVIEVWHSILTNSSPLLKGFVVIGILAVAISTVDAYLNSCSVVLSHDMVETIIGPQIVPYKHQLRLAKWIAFLIGTVTILLSYSSYDLIVLTGYYFDCFIPIVPAPFILAILGFRGAFPASVGMTTGLLAILTWNLWIKPVIGINGSFLCMLANGLAMLLTHYVTPKSKCTGLEHNLDMQK